MAEWSFEFESYVPEEEGLREALCTLGNGYFCTRGAAPESVADGVHYPGTYFAGGYNRLETEIEGHVVENEDLVNMPNWLPFTFRFDDGPWFDLERVELLDFLQQLDLRQGTLNRMVTFRDGEGRETRLVQRRLVHMLQPHLAALCTEFTPLNWSGRVEVISALDGCVVNGNVARYRSLNNQHLIPLRQEAVTAETVLLKVATRQSDIRVALAARTQVYDDGHAIPVARKVISEPGYIGQRFAVEVQEGSPTTFEKIVALFTSKDDAISECALEAERLVDRPTRFSELAETHALGWEQLWRRFDIGAELADPRASRRTMMIVRLYVMQLLQTVSPNTRSLDAGVPARGLHGEAYRGHIFWDELFIFPLLNLRVPEVTRALLRYRHRRLGEARYAAWEAGYRGAMYPWQSGSDGREESQQLHLNPRSGRWIPDHSSLQRHVNAAIAYNAWQYYQVTHDTEFLAFYGAEIILEIARFFGSIATYNEALDRYEILGVVGPDEYHEAYPDAEEPGLNNNAYTNVMAVWVINRAFEALELLPEHRRRDLVELLDLRNQELNAWSRIARKMRVCFHDGGIISQFEGYEKLEELDWAAYREKYGDIQRLDRILEAEDDTANRYKASKQADVLMLFYLFSSEELIGLFGQLGYEFSADAIPRNVAYYLERTSHGSTLSRVVHAWVMARSDRSGSWNLFNQALESDVADVQGGTTPEGIHLGAMAGTVDILQRGYMGMETRGDVLWLNPRLPHDLSDLRMNVVYRGYPLRLHATHRKLVVISDASQRAPVQVGVHHEVREVCSGETHEFIRPNPGPDR